MYLFHLIPSFHSFLIFFDNTNIFFLILTTRSFSIHSCENVNLESLSTSTRKKKFRSWKNIPTNLIEIEQKNFNKIIISKLLVLSWLLTKLFRLLAWYWTAKENFVKVLGEIFVLEILDLLRYNCFYWRVWFNIVN